MTYGSDCEPATDYDQETKSFQEYGYESGQDSGQETGTQPSIESSNIADLGEVLLSKEESESQGSTDNMSKDEMTEWVN